MNGVVNFFRGTAWVEITGVDPQRCINRFLKYGVAFSRLEQPEDCILRCEILKRDLPVARQAVRQTMCELTVLQQRGFGQEFQGLLRRPVLLVSALLLALAVVILPNFIWTMEVEGNEEIPAEKILQELEDLGVHFGTWIPSLSNQEIKNQMLLRIPELQWLAVNCSGGKATVMVSERSPSEDTVSRREVTNLVACRDGVIVEMSVLSGMPVCSVGQAVQAGEILVSGYADWGHSIQATRSMGEIYAETMHKIDAVMPQQVRYKQETGKTSHAVYLTLGRKRIKLFGSSGISETNCDKIVSEKTLTLPGGYALPLTLTVETYTAYEAKDGALPQQQAWQILQDGTRRQLEASMVAGQCSDSSEQQDTSDGLYRLETTAWCREMIARAEPAPIFTNEEETNGANHQRGEN